MSYHQETIDEIVSVMMAEKFYRDGQEDTSVKRIVTSYAGRIKKAKEAMKIASNAVEFDGHTYYSRDGKYGYETTVMTGDEAAYRKALETIVTRIEDTLSHPMDAMFLAGCLSHIKQYAKDTLEGIRGRHEKN